MAPCFHYDVHRENTSYLSIIYTKTPVCLLYWFLQTVNKTAVSTVLQVQIRPSVLGVAFQWLLSEYLHPDIFPLLRAAVLMEHHWKWRVGSEKGEIIAVCTRSVQRQNWWKFNSFSALTQMRCADNKRLLHQVSQATFTLQVLMLKSPLFAEIQAFLCGLFTSRFKRPRSDWRAFGFFS